MSYDRRGGGGGGYRRRHRDDYDDRRREVYESPEEKLRNTIIKLGEVDAAEELPRLVKTISEHQPFSVSNVAESLRIAVTEQPYKIPYYAALIRLLHDQPGESPESPSLGRQILEDYWKGFQAYLDKLAWREARFCMHLFGHLTVARLVSAESFFTLLQSFTAVLDEFGCSYGRGKKAALCAAEGLMIGGPALVDNAGINVEDIVNSLQTFTESANNQKWLVQPAIQAHDESVSFEHGAEHLDSAIAALRSFISSSFSETADCFPQPYSTLGELDSLSSPFSLPLVLVPPEVLELDGLDTETEEEATVKKEEWPEYSIRTFDNEISPDPSTPAGYVIRAALLDIIDVFEINRKECARLLLEYPKWTIRGNFKPKPGAPTDAEREPQMPFPGREWQLESTIVETMLGALFALPESQHKSVFYISLITELCKLSPQTVGPAVGKSIRKLYGILGEGLEAEAARKFTEWFSVHMSNFGFQWVWKEWIPDLVLDEQHPRRTFMRRAIEFEIRLAYHERILKTLPPPMQDPTALVISETGPGPQYEYEDPSHPHHEAAQGVLNLLRGRAKAEDVIAHLDTLKSSLESSDEVHLNVDSTVRSIAVQSLLSIGSRSFSHLLNAIERYLPILRNISMDSGSSIGVGGSPEAKLNILTASASFWRSNRQMVAIVFDKLMQYQIVDPTDLVNWLFFHGADSTGAEGRERGHPLNLNAFGWDLMKSALDKANGRVAAARKKVAALKKEDDDTRARAKAKASADVNVQMEVDAETKPEDEEDIAENPALITAQKAFSSLIKEQKAVLSRALEGFVAALAPGDTSDYPNPYAKQVITDRSWHNRVNWAKDEWNAWETWSWYRQFCRAYAPYLRNYSTTLSTISFARLEGTSDPAAAMIKKTWNIATGQE